MSLTSDQVKKVAKLANLPLDESQVEKYAQQLSKVLDYIEKLNQVDTSQVDPMYNPTGRSNILRKGDQVKNWLSQDEALKNGPKTKDGFFVTKGIFEDE